MLAMFPKKRLGLPAFAMVLLYTAACLGADEAVVMTPIKNSSASSGNEDLEPMVMQLSHKGLIQQGKHGLYQQPLPNLLASTTVFKSGEEGYACFRIPAIIQTGSGALLAFAEGRKLSCADHGWNDLVSKKSTDQGNTWSSLKVCFDSNYQFSSLFFSQCFVNRIPLHGIPVRL